MKERVGEEGKPVGHSLPIKWRAPADNRAEDATVTINGCAQEKEVVVAERVELDHDRSISACLMG